MKLTCELAGGAEKTALIKFTAQHWLRLLRSLACVVLMAVGFCSSAIAACTPIVAPVSQVSKIGSSLGSVGLGSTVLLSRSTQATNEIVNKTTYKVTLNNCTDVSSFSFTSFPGAVTNVGTNESLRIFIGGGSESEPFQTKCVGPFTGKCEVSSGSTTGLTTGIGLEYAISVSGTTAPTASNNCTISRNSFMFSWTPANCSIITVTHIHTMIRIKNLSPAGTLNTGFASKTNAMSMTLSNNGIVDLSTQPGMLTKFTYLTPTCSINMPSTVNLGEVALDTVQNATPGNQVGTWQNISILLNCSTDGRDNFDKLFTWRFAKPAADALSMLNDGGSATGVSAQIRVNQSLKNVDGSTNSSGIIKSGLTYEGPLKGNTAISPTYSVGFIRNSDAVGSGSFSSNATLSVDYR